MDNLFPASESPVQEWTQLGRKLGVRLLVKRDDLLPFPLAGNKYRKLLAEYRDKGWRSGDVLISNGGVDSNHCRTLAWFGALLGCAVHLVLHGSVTNDHAALRVLERLRARYELVDPESIGSTLRTLEEHYDAKGVPVQVIPGGCHTPAGAQAYRVAGLSVLQNLSPDAVFVASGTGATQGGLVAAARQSGAESRVVGVSVGRSAARGKSRVLEAARWADPEVSMDEIRFVDSFLDGGYGEYSQETSSVVEFAWSHGLPLDATYTGKAFRGLIAATEEGAMRPGAQVLFWHTGGNWNALRDVSK